jgi:hypothetical protein
MSGDAQGIVNADEFDANEAPIMLQKLRALQFLSCCLLGPLLGLISLALVPLFHAKTTEAKGWRNVTRDPRYDKSEVVYPAIWP